MIGYLLRWQLLFLKRDLLSIKGMIPLLANIAFQVILLTSLFASPQDFADNLTMVVIYASAFAISQTTTMYAQALEVTSSGLLGIAPIPARPRVAMAMFEMLVTVTLQAFVISLGLGIGLMGQVNVLGGLLVWILSFFAALFLYGGVAVGFTAFITIVLPAKYRKSAAALTSMLYVVAMILYLVVKHRFPDVITRFADVFINTAAHGFGPEGQSVWFFGSMLFGLVLGMVPMAWAYGKILLQTTPSANTDSKTYNSRIVPRGITQIFFWRERIAFTRNHTLAAVLVIGIVVVMLIPSGFNTFFFIYLGVQMGAFILSIGHPKSLALIYTTPMMPSKIWTSRIIALLPITSIGTVAFLFASILHAGGISIAMAICDILLPFAGLFGVSFTLMLDPSMFTTTSRKKQSIAKVLTSTILFSFVPLGLGFLCDSQPWIGVVISVGIIFGLLFYGTRVLNTKKSVRYLFQ